MKEKSLYYNYYNNCFSLTNTTSEFSFYVLISLTPTLVFYTNSRLLLLLLCAPKKKKKDQKPICLFEFRTQTVFGVKKKINVLTLFLSSISLGYTHKINSPLIPNEKYVYYVYL